MLSIRNVYHQSMNYLSFIDFERRFASGRIYLHSRVDTEASLECFAWGDGLHAGLGREAVAKKNRHVFARQEQIVGVICGLLYLMRCCCSRVQESCAGGHRGVVSGTRGR